jgi:hypothetical protein
MPFTNCDYCNNYHSAKECALEKRISPLMKKIVGYHMEQFVADEIYCPRCNNKTLMSLGTHAPSLDLICKSCSTKFEIKSKCMSNKIIPNDLVFCHGNYNDYKRRQKESLDFILIVYSVDRKTKIINIRRLFWIPDEITGIKECIEVIKKKDSSLSEIIIPNHKNLPEIIVPKRFGFDFSEQINTIIEEIKNSYQYHAIQT